jgi:hypothetical protein
MAQQTKLQMQIEASAKKIQDEQRKMKHLEKKQAEQDRKDRNHRLCKRHGFLEKILPDTINLTDEQFQDFVKRHIANRHGIAAVASLLKQTTQPDTATNNTPTTNGTEQIHGNQQPKDTTQNTTNPVNSQDTTA